MKKPFTCAIMMVAIMAPSTVSAKPKRAVVLLDFSLRPAAIPEVTSQQAALSSPELDAISVAMARQFTGASPDDPSSDLPPWVQPQSVPSRGPMSFGNPFVSYAISRQPFAQSMAMLPLDPRECDVPSYRPSFGFGRSAEERRRLIYPLVHRAACEHGLPVGLLDALIMQESRYQATALSPKGAIGLAQLMPGTARHVGVDAYTLADNVRGGARYLKEQYNRFGRYDLALAAYNAGPGRVQKGWAVPPIAETQGYVRTIMANWTGVAPPPSASRIPLAYRQAQLVFMPARTVQYAQGLTPSQSDR